LTLIIDAAPLVALADATEPQRDAIRAILTDEPGALVVPAPITAEIDYLLGQRFGHQARRAFLRDLAAGRFVVAGLDREDYATVVELESRYADLHLVLSDCALVVLAGRYDTSRILSFDERHFRAITPLTAKAFTILPADA
jgi:predicted nucleic acid-binding protein